MSGSKRKIAVTGATGQIGGALVRLLAGESGLQVVEAAAPSSRPLKRRTAVRDSCCSMCEVSRDESLKLSEV
ncbi:MAG TPA: hypothetical protein VGL34_15650 [Steroidobacteraceae bacterium]